MSLCGDEKKSGGGFFSKVHDAIYDTDLYGYTPNLLATSFRTPLSVITSLLMYALFLFTIGYTSYFWLATPYDLMQSQDAHADGMALIPPLGSVPGMKDLPPSSTAAPQLGVRMQLNDAAGVRSTVSLTDPSFISMRAEQEVICASSRTGRVRERLATTGPECEFLVDGVPRVNDSTCIDYAASYARLVSAPSNLTKDPCGTGLEWPAPRVAGTFYSDEYAYLTFSFGINRSHPDFQTGRIYMAEVQVYLSYPYTSTNSLVEGSFPSTEKVLFSRRVGLVVGHRVNWEINLRVRQLVAESWFWSIPALETAALDFTVASSEVSMEAPDPTAKVDPNGRVDLAKVYVRLDERDDVIELQPFSSIYSLIGDWGGYLSIIFCAGLPAYAINQCLFQRTVKRLIKEEKITFDDEVRKRREDMLEEKTRALMASGSAQQKKRGASGRMSWRLSSGRGGNKVDASKGAALAGAQGSYVPPAETPAGQQQVAPPAALLEGKPSDAAVAAVLGSATPAGLDQQRLLQLTHQDSAAPEAACGIGCTASHRHGAAAAAAASGADALGVGSLTVRYAGDAFEDEDALDHNYDDVVRHCTAECTSMYHLRQVVMLVQDESRASDLLGSIPDHLPRWMRRHPPPLPATSQLQGGGASGEQAAVGADPACAPVGVKTVGGNGVQVVVELREGGAEKGTCGAQRGTHYSDSGSSTTTQATASRGGPSGDGGPGSAWAGAGAGVDAGAPAGVAAAGGPLLRAAGVRAVSPEDVRLTMGR